ncbi:hypothetical protein OVV87_04050, partial [Klebsiella pneumoniae]|nr:hypothetical protein [Klebsiella pneumoniae]
GKNSLNRLIRCVCGKKIGPDPRNFNQRVSLGRNDLLIRTFPNDQIAMLKEISEKQSAQIDLLIALAHKKEEPEKDYLEEARKKAGLI